MIREFATLRKQQELNWAALQSFRTLAGRVLEELHKQGNNSTGDNLSGSESSGCLLDEKSELFKQAITDLENINAYLFAIETQMERVFDVRFTEDVEKKFIEHAGELAPDPLNLDRLRLNRLLHQTPDLPDRS